MEWALFHDEDRTSNAERHVAWVRFVLILFNIVVYYAVMDHTGTFPLLAAFVSVVAGLYGASVVILRPYQIFGVMRTSQWTTGTDALLIVLWLAATGGAASPFFVLWLVSLVAIGYRYGPRATVTATAMYVLLDAVFLARGGLLGTATGMIRLGYIAFTGGLMAFASGYTILGIRKQERLEIAVQDLGRAKDEADEAQSRLGGILENAPSTIFEVDLDGCISYINRVVEGLTKDQVLGQKAESFVAEHSRVEFRQALAAALDRREQGALDVEGYGAGMEIRTYRTHMGPLMDAKGNVRGAILITMDITDEKEQAEMAREAQRSKEMVARLEEESQFRNRFINTAAHELNTPMTPLRLQMGVLRQVLGASRTELRAVDIMERNLIRLGGLVTDLLDATRLHEGELRLVPASIDLGGLISDAVETFAQVAQERQITLEGGVDPGTVAYADPQRVSQIVYNLISNALKFTPAGGRVQCEGLVGPDDQVEVTVTDNGPGFTEAEMARLFLPFSQIHASLVPQEPGTGLGLYLSRNLALANGGLLEASSPGPDKGATFRLSLPRHKREDGGDGSDLGRQSV